MKILAYLLISPLMWLFGGLMGISIAKRGDEVNLGRVTAIVFVLAFWGIMILVNL
jgi:hypothetical protein